MFRPIAANAMALTQAGQTQAAGAAPATPASAGATTAADATTSILSSPSAPGDPRDAGLAAKPGSNAKGSSILGTKAGILGVGAAEAKKSVLGG